MPIITNGNDTLNYSTSLLAISINALGGDDRVTGSSLNDTIYGGNGNDIIFGGSGNDRLFGDDGNDFLNGGSGSDSINGGIGNDTVDYSTAGSGVFVNLSITASQANSYINALGVLVSNGEAAGDKIINVENLTGSKFADILQGNSASNIISAGSGNDYIYTGTGNDNINGGTGTDTIDLSNILAPTSFNNYYTDTYTNLDQGVSAQIINAYVVNNQWQFVLSDASTLVSIENVSGGNLKDNISGNNGNNVIYGNGGLDILYGQGGSDTIYGGEGDDTIWAFDFGCGGLDDLNTTNYLYGGNGNDYMSGSGGIDFIFGGEGNDYLFSGPANDVLDGGNGNDWFDIGSGNNILTGGGGADRFDFAIFTATNKITDFNYLEDYINLHTSNNTVISFSTSGNDMQILIDLDLNVSGINNTIILQGLANLNANLIDINFI